MSPAGRKFDQKLARELAQEKHLLLISGSYEGVDERVVETLVDDRSIHRRFCADQRRAARDVDRGFSHAVAAGSAG